MVKTRFRSAGASDPGRIRTNNEDAWHIDADRGIFLVVDGLGGQAAGEKAAAIAVERVRARLERYTGTTEQRLREAVTMANNEIYRASRSNSEWSGMACVLTAVVVENGEAVAGHVGDSRLYKIRGGAIAKITHDHSPVGEREDRGELGEEEAMRHPRRNEVFRDVGSEEHTPDDADFIEIRRFNFEPDSALVLCSDGLSDLLTSGEIRRIVEQNAQEPERAARDLIAAANRAGGKDNVTAVVVMGEEMKPVAPPRVTAPTPARVPVALWIALPLLAVAAGLAGARIFRPLPVTVVERPQILTVGRGQQFTSIAAAMLQAKAGDTVEVLVDEYHEQVILKTGVTIKSKPVRAAILRAAPLSNGPAVVADGVKNARFSGFQILAGPEDPLPVAIQVRNSEVEIDDTEISGATIGIEIRGPASPVLRGNSIHDCSAQGVLIIGPSTPWVSHNTFQRNQGAGLAARDGARPSLVSNLFEKNPVELDPSEPMDAVRAHNFFPDVRSGGRAPRK
jgi:serine/threonine protein phosphatase PrpC